MKKKDLRSQPAKTAVTAETLKLHAETLVRVLFALQKKQPDLTSDALWSAIKTYWTEDEFKKAAKAFEARSSIGGFCKLLSAEERRPGADGTFVIKGIRWGTFNSLAGFLKISTPSIRSRVERTKCRSMKARTSKGALRTYYALPDVQRACFSLLEKLPHLDGEGFVRWKGRICAPANRLAKKLGVGTRTLNERLKEKGIKSYLARNQGGRRAYVFAEDDARRVCADLIADVPRISKNGTCVIKNKTWSGAWWLSALWKVSLNSILSRVVSSKMLTLKGRNQSNREIVLYPVSEVRRACADLLKKYPEADGSGFCKIRGVRFGSLSACARELKFALRTVQVRILRAGNVRIEKVRERNGLRISFYALSDVKKVCADLLQKKKRAQTPS